MRTIGKFLLIGIGFGLVVVFAGGFGTSGNDLDSLLDYAIKNEISLFFKGETGSSAEYEIIGYSKDWIKAIDKDKQGVVIIAKNKIALVWNGAGVLENWK